MVFDYGDFEAFMQEVTGKPFEITESPNDTAYYFPKIEQFPPTNYDLTDGKKIVERGWCEAWHMWTLLRYLCHEEYLAPGNYLMRVSW